MAPTYSIVIPAYNESARLGATLEKVLAYVHAQGWDAEVIVVNDGSRDGTGEIVRNFAAKDPILKLIDNPGNRGKGYSVRNGMLQAQGRVILFSDADLSSPIEEAPKLLSALEEGADIAIGSRWLRAETQTQRQPLHRQLFCEPSPAPTKWAMAKLALCGAQLRLPMVPLSESGRALVAQALRDAGLHP